MLDFTLGGIQFQQDKVPEALANYQRAVAKFPAFRRAWRNLGPDPRRATAASTTRSAPSRA